MDKPISLEKFQPVIKQEYSLYILLSLSLFSKHSSLAHLYQSAKSAPDCGTAEPKDLCKFSSQSATQCSCQFKNNL